MGPTRKRDVAAAAAVVAIISYLAVPLLYRWFPPITVDRDIAAGGRDRRAGLGPLRRREDRRRSDRRRSRRLHPLAVARTVVVAKASAWMGALVLGFWLGVLGYLLPRRSTLHVADQDTGGAVVAAASALALLIAALWLQNRCKSPHDPGPPTELTGNQAG